MTVIRDREDDRQVFYRSAPLPCPYLPGRTERKLFTRLRGPEAGARNSLFTRAGFRRSHDIVYRPICPGCSACVPVRIPSFDYRPGRSGRRVMRANNDLRLLEQPAIALEEHYHLFHAYQKQRHGASDMAAMDFEDYRAMIEDGAGDSRLQVYHDRDGVLVAVMLADQLDDGYSAVYSFFDPAASKRSLGHYMIAMLVECARLLCLPYVYLGYWVEGSEKMAYKGRFRPLEGLVEARWQRIDGDEEA